MWPFKKKNKQKKQKAKTLIRMTPVETVELGLPITPAVPIAPNFPESTHVAADTEEQKTVDLKAMTVVELKNYAKELGLEGYSALNKSDLIAFISNSK